MIKIKDCTYKSCETLVIITYHYTLQPISMTAHSININSIVTIFSFGDSIYLSVLIHNTETYILIQPIGHPLHNLATKPQPIQSHTQLVTFDLIPNLVAHGSFDIK